MFTPQSIAATFIVLLYLKVYSFSNLQVDIVALEIAQGRFYNNLSAILRPVPVKSKSPLEERAFEFDFLLHLLSKSFRKKNF